MGWKWSASADTNISYIGTWLHGPIVMIMFDHNQRVLFYSCLNNFLTVGSVLEKCLGAL